MEKAPSCTTVCPIFEILSKNSWVQNVATPTEFFQNKQEDFSSVCFCQSVGTKNELIFGEVGGSNWLLFRFIE